MSSEQIQAMMRSPEKMMRFHTTGQLPTVSSFPPCPLSAFFCQIPQGYWRFFGAIKISPQLGFRCQMQFQSIHRLMSLLGHNQRRIDNATMPYQSHLIRGFNSISLETIEKHCIKPLPDAVRLQIQRYLKR